MERVVESKNVLKVIRNLTNALPLAAMENHLDMNEPRVNRNFSCGTIHCHGGWYAIGSGLTKDDKKFIVYTNGAHQVALDLGFDSDGGVPPILGISIEIIALQQWANDNPEIWGNAFGASMFTRRIAFKSANRPQGAMSLQDIVDHWQEVYERIKTKEEQDAMVHAVEGIVKLPTTEKKEVVLELVN